jgi:LacI family transcriptional regulator/LacI family repressor for deo operon, udp, cdd, tsx, nupC, and nupG
VSKATVSAVINDSGPVRDSTRDRVRAAIEALNYRRAPGSGAAAVRQGRCIALVIKEIDNPYYGEIISAARAQAQLKGYTLLAVSSEGEYDAERRAVDLLQAKDVDGLIVTPVLDEHTDLSHLFELKRRNFPFVLLEEVRGVQASLVDVDNVEGSRLAVAHLIDQGHVRIAHFAGPSYSTHSMQRVDGVHRACSASRLIFNTDDVVPAGAHLDDGYRCGLEYFRGRSPANRPTAVTCYNDLVAVGLCRALAELGLRVPEDVSVVGFDDIGLLGYLPLPLTTVRIPKSEMGRIATEMLVHQIESSEIVAPRKVYLDAELVVLGSTAAPSHPAAPSRSGRRLSKEVR